MRAGDRDRTGMASLEGWSSTIELRPREALTLAEDPEAAEVPGALGRHLHDLGSAGRRSQVLQARHAPGAGDGDPVPDPSLRAERSSPGTIQSGRRDLNPGPPAPKADRCRVAYIGVVRFRQVNVGFCTVLVWSSWLQNGHFARVPLTLRLQMRCRPTVAVDRGARSDHESNVAFAAANSSSVNAPAA